MRLIPFSIKKNLECQKNVAFRMPAQAWESSTKGVQEGRSHCLSTSMTEQPFLRFIPFDIRENLRCQKKCRFPEGRLLTFVIPHGAGILVGRVGRHSFNQPRAANGSVRLRGTDMRIMPVPAFGGPRAAMGEYFMAPLHTSTFVPCPKSNTNLSLRANDGNRQSPRLHPPQTRFPPFDPESTLNLLDPLKLQGCL